MSNKEIKVARASNLGYGSQGLCPFCENELCKRWGIVHNNPLVELIGVIELCPTGETQGYKNKKDGFI